MLSQQHGFALFEGEALVSLGDCAVAEGRLDSALARYTQALESFGEIPRLLLRLGSVRHRLGDSDGAQASLERVVEMTVNQGYTDIEYAARDLLAVIFEERGDAAQAFEQTQLARSGEAHHRATAFDRRVSELLAGFDVERLAREAAEERAKQSRDALDDKKNVWEEISGGYDVIYLGKREINSRGYCSTFNFKGADQQKKVGMLSGGERNRVHLAKMLKLGANVLLLDEPTNDLDVDTLRALEDALTEYAGCAVIISHDRFFLDRIATHMLAFEGDSHVEWFEGNFQDYEEDKKRRLGIDSVIPHRLKYKKFSR
jgi:tetratricopeptide (TPR) repeat protein